MHTSALAPRQGCETKVDFALFPKFEPWPGPTGLSSIQIANFHYVAHLAKTEPAVRAAVINVGIVKTDVMRLMPLPMRIAFNVLSPLYTSVERAAANATWLSTNDKWTSGSYWPKPGRKGVSIPLDFDAQVTSKVISISRELAGA